MEGMTVYCIEMPLYFSYQEETAWFHNERSAMGRVEIYESGVAGSDIVASQVLVCAEEGARKNITRMVPQNRNEAEARSGWKQKCLFITQSVCLFACLLVVVVAV